MIASVRPHSRVLPRNLLLHHPIDPLVVRGLAALGQGSAAQDRMHPAIAVGGRSAFDGLSEVEGALKRMMRLGASSLASAVVLLFGQSFEARSQPLGVNPSAAPSDIGNPSSINPAARPSDIGNPSALNPAATASQASPSLSPSRPAITPCPARRVSGSRCLLGVPNAQTARRTRGNGVVLRRWLQRAKPIRPKSAAGRSSGNTWQRAGRCRRERQDRP